MTTSDQQADKLKDQCKKLIEQGKSVEAVRLYRKETGCGLPSAMRELGLRH